MVFNGYNLLNRSKFEISIVTHLNFDQLKAQDIRYMNTFYFDHVT